VDVKILSGVSGAGKSTFIQAQSWSDSCVIHSADYFFSKDGPYSFDPSKLNEAHGECLRGFVNGVRSGDARKRFIESPEGQALQGSGFNSSVVEVVDNTNLSVEEIAPYYALAKAYGYEVELITLLIDPEIAAHRNVHGVSERVIERMQTKLRARTIPPFWNLKYSEYYWHEQQATWVKETNRFLW